jgi:hypothetical protein
VVEVDRNAKGKVAIDVFANNAVIASYSLEPGTTLSSIPVPSAILGASDPLSFALAKREQRDALEFAVRKLRIRQDSAIVPLKLSSGLAIDLAEQLPEVAYKAEEPAEQAISFVLANCDEDDVLVIHGVPHPITKVELDGEGVNFLGSCAGYALIPPNREDGFSARGKVHLSADWLAPLIDDGIVRCSIALRKLAPLDAPATDGALRIIPLGAWHDAEESGAQWAAGETVSFWVRPGTATGIILVGNHINGPEAVSKLVVTIDGEATNVEIQPEEEIGLFTIRIPLAQSSAPLRTVTLSRLPTARPVDLGINLDERTLSLRLQSFRSFEEDEEVPYSEEL